MRRTNIGTFHTLVDRVSDGLECVGMDVLRCNHCSYKDCCNCAEGAAADIKKLIMFLLEAMQHVDDPYYGGEESDIDT